MTFFRKKCPFFTLTISDDLLLVIDQVFQILRFFTVLNVVYDPFFTKKPTISEKNSFVRPFFTLFVLSRASDNTTSLNIEGTNAWAVPHLKFWGGPSPHSPLGLRPCSHTIVSHRIQSTESLPQLIPCLRIRIRKRT